MKKPRVLLTGGSGLLALNWACAVRDEWDVVLGTHQHSVELTGTSSLRLDLDDPAVLKRQFDQISPDMVVHAAGLTNVDLCENSPELASHVNAFVSQNVAFAADQKKVALIHISTDHLFAGDKSLYSEVAEPCPLNAYGRSKLLAEELVQQVCPQALLLRTNFFGWGSAKRQSFSDWIIYNLRANNSISLFDDVYFTPILADVLALTAHELASRGVSGIFNLVGGERVSKYDYAQLLAKHFALPLELIRRDQVVNAKLRAPRPNDMSLDITKLHDELGRSLGSLDEYFRILHSQEEKGRRVELLHSVS
jgi:dTDP-4-dehydrorhamnose reductase